MALALYVATSAYRTQAQEEGPTPIIVSNMEFLFTAMEAIGREHKITLNILSQAISDVEEAGLTYAVRVPKLAPPRSDEAAPCGQIPLFARSRVSKRTAGILPPLPGRLPLHKPAGGRRPPAEQADSVQPAPQLLGRLLPLGYGETPTPMWNVGGPAPAAAEPSTEVQESRSANKRRRMHPSHEPSSLRFGNNTPFPWSQYGPVEELSSSSGDNTPAGISLSAQTGKDPEKNYAQLILPRREGSSTGSSPAAAANSSSATSSSSTTSPGHTAAMVDHLGHASSFGATGNAAAAATLTAGTHPPSGVVGDMDMYGLNGWDAAHLSGAQDPSAAFAGMGAMAHDDSWMMLNDGAALRSVFEMNR